MLPVAVRRGWREADPPRRAFALLAVALPVAWLASLARTWDEIDRAVESSAGVLALGGWTALVLLGGPPACYSAARVLRPHPAGTGAERRARHWCAAIATAYGLSLLTWVTGLERGVAPLGFGAVYVHVLAASALGPLTLVWGLLAAARRLHGRRAG